MQTATITELPVAAKPTTTATVGKPNDRIATIIKQLERLNEDADAIKTDIKEILVGAKSEGFNPSAIKKVISIRAKDREKNMELADDVRLYLEALGDNRQGELAI